MDQATMTLRYGQPSEATNGQIIDIHRDISNEGLPSITSSLWVLAWMGRADSQVPPTILKSKILRVIKKAGTLRRAALERYREEPFEVPKAYLPQPSSSLIVEIPQDSPSQPLLSSSLPVPTPDSPMPTPSTSFQDSTTNIVSHPSPPRSSFATPTRPKNVNTPQKKMNTTQHQIQKKTRQISVLEKRLQSLKVKLVDQARKNSHYDAKNVRKREERSFEQRRYLRQDKMKCAVKAKQLEKENERLKNDLKDTKRRNVKLRQRVMNDGKEINALRKEKNAALKRVRRYERLPRMKSPACKNVKEKQDLMLKNDGERRMDTKKTDGEFTDQTRFCVMELTGLEVATGKIGAVMETVGALCGVKFSDLPSRAACQRIVDEGQVIAKDYIRENVIMKCKKFGIHKDGTRKKVKILDTSISTDTGDSFCLGWGSVASETGQAIADETKGKLEELVDASSEGGSMKDVLQKLDYLMNDRAANEKKSSHLIEEWRAEVLKSHGEDNIGKVQHLFCAAHVLLGFHTYALDSVRKLDMFSTPSKEQKHPVTLILKDASDLFGPVGDYRGLRNQWEAYCLE